MVIGLAIFIYRIIGSMNDLQLQARNTGIAFPWEY